MTPQPPEDEPRGGSETREHPPWWDATWKRVSIVLGTVFGLGEVALSWIQRRPADQNILLFAAALIGGPIAAGRGAKG